MNPFAAWKRPLAMAEQVAGLIALGGLWYWWLDIAETSAAKAVLSLAVLLALAAGLWLLARRGRARLGVAAAEGGGGSALVALLLLAMSCAAAFWLVWWVPQVDGLRTQVASMVARFGAALLLIATFWGNLLASLPGKRAAT